MTLLRWPGNLCGAGETMLLLDKDTAMRGLAASGLIDESDCKLVGRKRLEEQVSVLTAPDFHDVVLHVRVLLIARTERDIEPLHSDPVLLARGVQNGRRRV